MSYDEKVAGVVGGVAGLGQTLKQTVEARPSSGDLLQQLYEDVKSMASMSNRLQVLRDRVVPQHRGDDPNTKVLSAPSPTSDSFHVTMNSNLSELHSYINSASAYLVSLEDYFGGRD